MTTRTILISGGSRGLGAATARMAAARGYDVALTYATNRGAAEAVARDVQVAGRRALVISADVADAASIPKIFAEVDAAFGRLDVFFNNAGVLGPIARFVDIPLARLQRTLAINTVAAFVVAQHAARRMSTRTGGHGGVIVNMSSMAAKLGAPGEAVDYGVSKGAIDTLTVGMAKELASEGVRVNAVRPGLIHTDIHASTGVPDRVERMQGLVPLQRGGTAEEVAEAVLWLASDQASYVTGVILDVAGGRGL